LAYTLLFTRAARIDPVHRAILSRVGALKVEEVHGHLFSTEITVIHG
jgi:hypothetical protein